MFDGRGQVKPQAAAFFDYEAVESGSDCGFSPDEEGSELEDRPLSGDFINDEDAFLQQSAPGEYTQYGMYLAVNRQCSDGDSPDAEQYIYGYKNVRDLVKKTKR